MATSMFEEDLEWAKLKLQIPYDLKEKQKDALRSLYEMRDTLAILPTGYGKSLIFQLLPFIFQKKLGLDYSMTVVIVTPLNSIMQDQIQQMCHRGIPSCYLNAEGSGASTFNFSAMGSVDDNDDKDEDVSQKVDFTSNVSLNEIREGKFSLVYSHPETLLKNKDIGKILRSKLYQKRVCCTVIDEVHMISEWGTDFRKSFSKLGELTCIFPDIPHLALTATATSKHQKELIDLLEFKNTNVITENPDRPNIYFEIRPKIPNIRKYEKFDSILDPIVSELTVQLSDYPVTIVYCENLESIGYCYLYVKDKLGKYAYNPVGEEVPENRIFAQYHKGYTDKMKSHIVTELTNPNPKLRLVFATVALGMGLNAPCVTQIIHFRPPTTLEKYFQEVGRAGRSGQAARSILYVNNNDIAANRIGLDKIVRDFVQTKTCLRKFLVNYFGYSNVVFNGSPQNCCSNCRNDKTADA